MRIVTTHGGGRLSRRCVRNRKADSLFQAVDSCTRLSMTGQRQPLCEAIATGGR
jgi:hypothetical protein